MYLQQVQNMFQSCGGRSSIGGPIAPQKKAGSDGANPGDHIGLHKFINGFEGLEINSKIRLGETFSKMVLELIPPPQARAVSTVRSGVFPGSIRVNFITK